MSEDWEDTTQISVVDSVPSADERDRAYLIVLSGSNVGEMFKLGGKTVIGRGRSSSIRLLDDGISRAHAEITVDDNGILLRDLDSRNGTYCNGRRINQFRLSDGDKIQVGRTTILKFTYHDRLDESFQRQMYASALRDALTNAFNRRYFLERIKSEYAFADRHDVPLALTMLDLDHFKAINDQHGHIAGDRVLSMLSARVQSAIRNEDVFSRYGGEEFAIISRATPPANALKLGERVRKMVERLGVVYAKEPIDVTVSVGISWCPRADINDVEGLIAAADRALYRAKELGRNRVVIDKPA